jgi:hypothetical protein
VRSGLGLSRSIRRRISVNSVLGTAHLGQLEHDVAAVAHDPGANLDQLLAERRQRPVLDLLGQGQGAHEVGRLVGQRVQLEPHRVVPEGVTGQPRPAKRVLAFLDVLLLGYRTPSASSGS